MKTNCLPIILLVFFTLLYTSSAQYQQVLRTERIYTPWDKDTTLSGNLTDISLSQEGMLIIFSSTSPAYLPTFYFYNDIQKEWSKKQLVDDKWTMHNFYKDYTIGFKRMVEYYNYRPEESTYNQALKWIFNYGDSLLIDTIKSRYEIGSFHCISPSLSYYSAYQNDPEITYNNFTYKPYNGFLYRRTNKDGVINTNEIFSLIGGKKGIPSSQQHYRNSISPNAIDSETVVAVVSRYSVTIPPNGDGLEDIYTLLFTNNVPKRIGDGILRPRRNYDKQWFFTRDPSTYLYSSPRHGITSRKPIYFGFIDEYLENVQVHSEYANGTKGYYGLCNSKTDSTEKDKFLIYSITNLGKLQKYIILDTFEYRNVASYDSSIYDKQILYADDTLMYVQLTTQKFVTRGLGTLDTIYYSQPQVYKIHLPNQTNEVEEQPLSTTLQLYPNPTDQILRWNIPNGRATITDALGVEVLSVPASIMQADISGLAIGVYYLTIRSGGESVTRVFTVMR